jgi:hypothetical protein
MKLFLSNRGNVDHFENPNKPVIGTKSDILVEVDNLDMACAVVREYIEVNNLGGGNWNGGQVIENDKMIGYISYNGKFWDKNSKYFDMHKKIFDEMFGTLN